MKGMPKPGNPRPRVSVIIPSYNCERFIRQAIHSVLTQTYRSFEVVVIDDGSTDNTSDVLSSFAGRICYRRQERQGPSVARNVGVSLSRGRYLAFLDADDCWDRSFLEKHIGHLDSNPPAGLSICWGRRVTPAGIPYGGSLRPPAAWKTRLAVLRDLLHSPWIPGPTAILMKRECFLESGMFDPSLRPGAEDWDLWLRMAARWRFVELPQVLYYYRRHCTFFPALYLKRGLEDCPRVLDRFFSTDSSLQLDQESRQRAYSLVDWKRAWAHYAVDNVSEGQRYLQCAMALDPSRFKPPYGPLIEYMAHDADCLFGPCTTLQQAKSVLSRFFDHLPPSAAHLNRIRRPTLGFAFGANLYRNRDLRRWNEVRRAGLLALWYRPAWLANRGFLSVWAKSLLPWLRPRRAAPPHVPDPPVSTGSSARVETPRSA